MLWLAIFWWLVSGKGDTRLGGRVIVLLVCQWMTIYDIHDIFMVISIMYYTRSKNQHSRIAKLPFYEFVMIKAKYVFHKNHIFT